MCVFDIHRYILFLKNMKLNTTIIHLELWFTKINIPDYLAQKAKINFLSNSKQHLLCALSKTENCCFSYEKTMITACLLSE